jgi:hypothetical protein
LLAIGDFLYYDRKMPTKSLVEILSIIKDIEEKIKSEKNIMKQKELLDLKDYWELEKMKLINYQKKTGKIYEITKKTL